MSSGGVKLRQQETSLGSSLVADDVSGYGESVNKEILYKAIQLILVLDN